MADVSIGSYDGMHKVMKRLVVPVLLALPPAPTPVLTEFCLEVTQFELLTAKDLPRLQDSHLLSCPCACANGRASTVRTGAH